MLSTLSGISQLVCHKILRQSFAAHCDGTTDKSRRKEERLAGDGYAQEPHDSGSEECASVSSMSEGDEAAGQSSSVRLGFVDVDRLD